MVKNGTPVILILVIFSIAAVINAQVAQTQVSLSLGKTSTQSNDGISFNYFNSTFNATKQLLAITLDPSRKSPITLFLSLKDSTNKNIFYQFPNSTHYTHKCAHNELNTCMLRLNDPLGQIQAREVTVYFSVQASQVISYSLLLELISEISLDVNLPQELSFGKSQSAAVLMLSGNDTQLFQEITVIFTYNKVGGSFNAIATVDEIPHRTSQELAQIKAVSNGAYHKIMMLPLISNNSNYYILVQSEKGSTITVSVYQSSPQLMINSTVIYKTDAELSYQLQLTNSTEQQDTTLFLRLSSYVGYGSFIVNYCNGFLLWNFGNINGMNNQLVISPIERLGCEQWNLQQTNSSFEFLNITIAKPLAFGYQLQLFEKSTNNFLVINQKLVSFSISNSSQRVYPLQIPTLGFVYFINFTQNANDTSYILFYLQQCLSNKTNASICTVIGNSSGLASGQLNFTSKLGAKYQLIADQQALVADAIWYELLLTYNQVNITELVANKKYLQEVALREHKFYHINLTSLQSNGIAIDDIAQVNITVKNLNGKVYLLSSLVVPDPTLEKYTKNSSIIKFQLNETTIYYVNKSNQVIYLSVYGSQDSLFDLDFTVDSNIDLPIRYLRLFDDATSNFTLNKTKPYQLLSYEPHIKPFTINLIGSPKCIRYGYALPLNQTCLKRLPSQFLNKKIYLNISNGLPTSSNFNFSITPSSGEYTLYYDNSIIMACSTPCYSIINVILQVQSKAIVKGKGEISTVENFSQTNVKDILVLSCATYPCSTQINATANYGGTISIYLEQSQISYLNDTTIPFYAIQLPKSLLFPIKSIQDINTLLIRSDGTNLGATYSILTLDSESNNIISINFTALSLQNNNIYYSDPLRNVFVLPITQEDINQLKCSQGSVFCIVAITLYTDIDVPFSVKFANRGLASASSNRNPRMSLPINSLIGFNESLRINNYEFTNSLTYTDVVRLNVEPISNCHPVVYDNSIDAKRQYQYGPILYENPTSSINFSVLTQQPCLYSVSMTSSPYRSISANKYYNLSVQNGEVIVILLFSYDGSPSFTITALPQGEQKIDYILINQMQNSYDSIVIPNIESNSFSSTNSNSLTVNQQKYNRVYAIRVLTKSSSIRLIAQNQDSIILTHADEVNRVIGVGMKQSFLILSRRIISLSLQSLNGKIEVGVSHPDGSQPFLNTTITHSTEVRTISQSLVQNQAISYGVTITNLDTFPLPYSIMFSQSHQYLKELYERIMYYDSFEEVGRSNCYNYQAPLQLGRQKVAIDFVLDGGKYPNCSCLDLNYQIFLKGTVESKVNSILKPILTKLNTTANAYRLQMNYEASQTYTICFSTPNRSAIAKEYYVIISSPLMKHMVEGEETIRYMPLALDNYQIIQEGTNQNVMFQLTICDPTAVNDKTLIGSPGFSDYLFGGNSNLADYHKNSDSIFAKVSASEGYYFLGVKNEQMLEGVYSLKYSSIGKDERLLAAAWDLESKDILNITMDKKGKIIISLPKLVNLNNVRGQNNLTLNYTIYIMDMTDFVNSTNATNKSSPLSLLSRCPNYVLSKTISPFAKQQTQKDILNKSVTFTFDNLDQLQNAHDQIVLNFNPNELPSKFNITGRVNLQANSQSFSYFYNTQHVELAKVDNSSEKKGSSSAAIVIVVILIIIVAGIVAFIWYRKSKNQDNVDFQLANFTENSPSKDKKEGLILTPKIEEKGYKEMIDDLQ